MSSKLIDRKHYVALGAFVLAYLNAQDDDRRGLFVYDPDTAPYEANYRKPEEVANILMYANEANVRALYADFEWGPACKAITAEEVAAIHPPTVGQMSGLLRSIEYQSCELPDYKASLPYQTKTAVVEAALALASLQERERLRITDTTGTTYEWA